MKPQSRKRFTLLASVLLVVGGLLLPYFLWIKQEQRHYAMNLQLIESLRQRDFKGLLALVEAGADPNTRVTPLPAPTWEDLLNRLRQRSALSANTSPTVFMVVCGVGIVPGDIESIAPSSLPHPFVDTPQTMPLVRVMLLHGANVNFRDEHGETVLMHATAIGLTDRVALFLEQGALIDLQDDYGDTALHYAGMGNHPELVKLLLKYHANPNLRDKDGDTPLGLALRIKASPEILRLLKAARATN